MADLTLPYDILNDTDADASTVQANFIEIEQYSNTQVVRIDGANTMAAPLRLFGDPVDPADAVRLGFLNAMLPLGVILPYAGLSVPGGQWAIANGASLGTTVYPDLFLICQYRFGGAGSSFNLPNFAGRVPIGQSAAAPFVTVGATGGNKDTTGLPSHSHGVAAHGHTASSGLQSAYHGHGINVYTGDQIGAHAHGPGAGTAFVVEAPGGAGFALNPGSQAIFSTGGTAGENANHHHPINATSDNENANHNHVVTVDNAPAINTDPAVVAVTDANLPPYVVVNYIIRVL